MLQNYGILFYGRFKDDILVVIVDGDVSIWNTFWQEFKRRAKFFEVGVTGMRRDAAVFLDVELWKKGPGSTAPRSSTTSPT